ncbi:MAG: GTP 3',8-cyclase MoaA [Gammaproteobacteria bacterium]|nr:GTP 3',8-cyclase MoaA [Gammaproteobacteria bacterium]
MLIDRFDRQVSYLRISVTDRCDLRCVYCMSDDMKFLPRASLLSLEEIIQVGRNFVELGVSKIRITGGEPLHRRNILKVFRELGALDGLTDLTLTTNGTQLPRFAQELRDAGVTRINISLDTLKAERYRAMTRNGHIERVMLGIDAALEAGFDRVKLNAVVLRNHNHDEVVDLVSFAIERGLDISFIEEMPLGSVGDHDRAACFYSSDQIRSDLAKQFELMPTAESSGGPSRYYRIPGVRSRIGFISPHSHNFCEQCNRVRLTSEGRLLLCLGQEHSADLRRVVRANPGDDEALKRAIVAAMAIKPRGHDFNLNGEPVIFRHMNHTGG